MKFSLLGKKQESFEGVVQGHIEYDIIRKLGEGGMGAVYLAKIKGVSGFEKVVAIKTMVDQYSNDPKFAARFVEEAKLVANLIHENIVQIYQLDRVKAGYYFILEYVDGISLHDFMEFHVRAHLALPPALAVFIAARVARGLAYAHSRRDADGNLLNIVHCDVCTHNIMINTEGVPKLMDFGIAKAVNRDGMEGISGKVGFMAPEQAEKNAKLTFAADIYSLGIVLFYLLSGQLTRTLKGELIEILMEVRANSIQWDRLPQGLDPELLEILRAMLAANPEERYQNTSELAHDLEYYIYKDGYGPTIVTLANYMRETMPGRFGEPAGASAVAENERTVVIEDPDEKTLVMQ